MPKRIKRERTKGWRLPANTVVVTRGTHWGNPFKIGEDVAGLEGVPMDAQDVVDQFQIFTAPTLDLEPLRGKDLCCWCALDKPCHADVLLKLANEGI